MESESPGGGGGGTLLVLEPKSLRSFTTNDEYLYAMKEDLADWFACLYKMPIDAETFLSILETGVILCRHANEVQHFFHERGLRQGAALAMRSYFIRSVPEGHVTCRSDVKPGTFQARDNVSNFISWCRNLGIPDVLRFETDDLVLRKNEKSVILCLLELARVGAKLGMLAPTIVRMEQEIDEELESGEPPPQIKTCDMKSLDELVRELVGQCSCPVQFPMIKVGEGKYQIGDSRTLIFVRVLRNHVMVRVGGGWDTLENYLDKHDPCRCHFRGHRTAAGAVTGPRHQILRRASTSNLIASRIAPSPTPTPTTAQQQPMSPRRMSAAAPASTAHSQGFVKGSSPGAGGGFSKGPSPARSASPTPSGFAKGLSPMRCASPTPGSNGVRRLPSPSPSHSSLRESRESSVGRSSSTSGGGLSRPSSPSLGQPLRQSYDQQQQQQRGHQQTPQPQHQAVQRCKSPSPAPGSRCVSPALSGNRTLPRPLSRGASGIPRPMSPALTPAPSSSSSASAASSSANPARRQLFSMARSVSFDAPTRTDAPAPTTTSRSSDDLDRMADTEIAEMNSGQQAEISMEQISTMTLSEFKKLINSNLSVPATPDGDSGEPDASRCRDQDGQGSAGGSGRGSVRRPGSADPQNLSWSLVRDKARSVCSSLASSVSSRRPGASGGNSSSSIIARRNLPRSPAGSDGSRPKTPSSYSSADRPKTPSAAERPKTPVSTYRPKTPITSAYAYRPKTPTAGSGAGGGEGQPSRPKTPTAVSGVGGEGQPARPKTPSRPKTPTAVGAYSRGPNASTAAGRNSEASRPKTPTRDSGGGGARGGGRPKTPTSLGLWTGTPNPRVQTTTIVSTADDTPSGLRVKNSSFVYSGEESDSGSAPENCESGGVKRQQQQQQHAAGLGVRSPSWASSSSNNNNDESSSVSLSLPLSRRSQSPADDLDGDNDEVAEMMSGDSNNNNNNNNSAHATAASLRERPSTPSRIPKPSFTPRPAPTPGDSDNSSVAKTPPSSGKTGVVHTVQRVLPRPSTPVGRGSGERRLSAGGEGAGDPTSDANKPPVTPRRSSAAAVPIPRSATPTSGKSYTEIFYARRAQPPGPVSSSSSSSSSSAVTMTSARPTTPGPGTSAGGLRGQQQFSNGRRGSLGKSLDLGKLRKAKSVTNLLDNSGGLSYAVHGSGDGGGGGGGGGGGRRSSSGGSAPQRQQTADPPRRSLQRQDAYETEGEVLTVSRNSQGGHSVRVTDQNRNVTYVSGARPGLPQSASFDNSSEQRARSKTPGPGVVPSRQHQYQPQQQPRGIIRKPSNPSPVTPGAQRGSAAHSKALNRTEAWVDSTLHDPKRKQLPPRPRRAMTPNSLSIRESDLLSRPLEEIQAALPSPDQGLPTPDPEVIEAPPEDPEMFRKMEQLFEKYREMELRASVCETPGAGGQRGYDADSNISGGGVGSVGRSSGSGVAGQGPGGHRASSSSRSSSSLRTDLTPSASFSSGISSAARSSSCREADSSRGTSAENDRFSKESSPAAAAATAASAAAHHYGNGAASNSGECPEANAGTDESACVPEAPPRHGQQGAPAVSADDIVGVDAEALASNPSALVSKIKEILQVRPRRDTTAGSKPGTRTRIPAPAPLSRAKRSKSASSLTNGDASLAVYEAAPNGLDVTRDESTNSDVSSDYGRCETPVPKLAQPLTTGRSTLFRRERSVGGGLGGGGGGRSMSQDDHVSTSSSLSSSSRRFWDEDGEFV